MPIPCVKGNVDGLSVFQATADQRFALGEALFLQTHLPVRFWVRHAGADAIWSETDLLKVLLASPVTLSGNRVFVLFGAAGAGKSEVMRWLLSEVGRSAPMRARFAVRVARTELDPVRITARLLDNFSLPGLGEDVLHRWDELQRKPVALANQLVWQALSGLFETDEEILPLSFRLRPVVEANLRTGFTAMSDPNVATRPLDLITREQLEQVLSDTILDVEPIYEHMRARLQAALEQHAQGGVSLIRSLRTISQHVRTNYGVRPLLIIDDLVQSMNVYASDLLDYLLTLEEGEWDVVLGLTPAAFEWDRRGRELLMRIRELDTVDDRVVKLDLSDTTGDTSSFLDAGSAAEFLLPYLKQYKQAAGFSCSASCSHWHRCTAIQWGQIEGAELSPLSPSFVRRLWRRLPSGKGRARYLLLAARRVLELMATSGVDALPDLLDLIDRDLYVNDADTRVKALLECYHPGGDTPPGEIPESMGLLFGLGPKVLADVSPLGERQAVMPGPKLTGRVRTDHHETTTDPVRAAVRDWVEGAQPNRELLKPLRNGLCRLLRDVVDPTLLVGAEFAQANGALRWGAIHDGVHIPLALEGMDTQVGIPVPRSLAGDAFDLLAYAEAKGTAKVALTGRLLERPQVISLLLEAEELRKRWRAALEEALGCGLPELAFHLHRVAISLGASLPVPGTFVDEASKSLHGFQWPEEILKAIEAFWEDCFRIRENLYDGHLLARYRSCWPQVGDSARVLMPILEMPLSDNYRLAEQPIGRVLSAYRAHLQRIYATLKAADVVLMDGDVLADACERLLDGRRRTAVLRRWKALSEVARGVSSIPAVPQLPRLDEARLVLELTQMVRASTGNEDVSVRYRPLVALERLRSHSWVRHVEQWQDQLHNVFLQARALNGDSAESAPRYLTDLMQETVSLLVKGAQRTAAASRVESLRHLVESDSGRFAHRLANLLMLVVPSRFEVAQYHAPQRQACVEFLRDWTATVKWLSGAGGGGLPPVNLAVPAPTTLTRWQQTIRMACGWWAAYVTQVSLLAPPGAYLEVTRVKGCLTKVATFELPTEVDVLEWNRFLAYSHRTGTTCLPIRQIVSRKDLPVNAQEWLHGLVAAEARGVSLVDLAPDVLAELQGRIPEWTQSIRVSVIPEGDSNGVLCFLDGQRPRVSDL